MEIHELYSFVYCVYHTNYFNHIFLKKIKNKKNSTSYIRYFVPRIIGVKSYQHIGIICLILKPNALHRSNFLGKGKLHMKNP